MALIYFKPWLINLIPAFPLAGFLINSLLALFGARKGKSVSETWPSLFGCLLPAISFAISLLTFFALKSSPLGIIPAPPLFSWIETDLFTVNLGFAVDHLTMATLAVIRVV